jgi:ketosteroid isomerase-like protein
MTASEVAMTFVSAINEHNLERLASIMSEDHLFIDGLDNRIQGRAAMIRAWRGYFSVVPDYVIKIEKVLERENEVALFGRAAGTYVREQPIDSKNRWEIPAAWLAEIRGDQISVWRVFADNLPIRRLMGGES